MVANKNIKVGSFHLGAGGGSLAPNLFLHKTELVNRVCLHLVLFGYL
jgi:hypothetical protein